MQVDETLVHTNNDDADRKALEAFVVDNHELERLEDLLIQFNIFEAIGAVWQELRHSDFLTFLRLWWPFRQRSSVHKESIKLGEIAILLF